jgi:hypothetical protein
MVDKKIFAEPLESFAYICKQIPKVKVKLGMDFDDFLIIFLKSLVKDVLISLK